jgi:hypothetical protein
MITVDLGGKIVDTLAYATINKVMGFYKLDPGLIINVYALDVDRNDSHAGCLHIGEMEYEIYINENVEFTPGRLCELIAHEMIHVKQYELDGLEDLPGDTVQFAGKFYRMENKLEYWLSPWEMEARAMEDFFAWQVSEDGWGGVLSE